MLKLSPNNSSREERVLILIHMLGFSAIRKLIQYIQRKPVTRFIAFHDIPPLAVSQFEANMCFLKKRTNVIGLDDFFIGNLSTKKINVVITFDDGYKSWVTSAIPILKKLELTATFFISSGYVDNSPEHDVQFRQAGPDVKSGRTLSTGCLSRKDVNKISENGFTVGGHTKSHFHLSDMGDSTQARNEIVDDKNLLELITGRAVNYFAYPFGTVSNPGFNISAILREAGYMGALTTIPNFNYSTTDQYMLHRDLTRASMPSLVFRAKVYGNMDIIGCLRRTFIMAQGHK